MHILVASPYLPWPLVDGGRSALHRTFEALAGACTFTLIVPAYSLIEEADAKKYGERFPNVTVKSVRCFHPASSLSRRTRLKRAAGSFLRTIMPASKKSGVAGLYYPFTCLNPNFVATVEAQLAKGCDLFQAEFVEMLTLGPLIGGRVPSLFVHHQLHYVYARRFMETSTLMDANTRYLKKRINMEEAAYLNTFDSAVVFSEIDRLALNDFCPQIPVHVSPFPSPEEPLLIPPSYSHAIRHFVFVASEGHHPNVEGLGWFMKDVWPTIKNRLPDATIEVIGKWSQFAQATLPNHEDIRFAGFVPELGKALQNKVMIVPVRIGSGIRTKILAAWGAACPVVTTSVGAEGLTGKTGEHFVVADDAPAFANACIEVSQNMNQLNRITANGLDLVKKHYSLEAVRKTRLGIYEQLLNGQPKANS